MSKITKKRLQLYIKRKLAGIKKEYLTGFLDCSKIKNVNFSHKTNKKDGKENAVLRRKIWIFPDYLKCRVCYSQS